jgi:hypothetical protein
MTEQEEKEMARRLARNSDIFDFEQALEVVRRRPADAQWLLNQREEMKRRQEERARGRARRKRALLEFR